MTFWDFADKHSSGVSALAFLFSYAFFICLCALASAIAGRGKLDHEGDLEVIGAIFSGLGGIVIAALIIIAIGVNRGWWAP